MPKPTYYHDADRCAGLFVQNEPMRRELREAIIRECKLKEIHESLDWYLVTVMGLFLLLILTCVGCLHVPGGKQTYQAPAVPTQPDTNVDQWMKQNSNL
jgi:hypothetical protein